MLLMSQSMEDNVTLSPELRSPVLSSLLCLHASPFVSFSLSLSLPESRRVLLPVVLHHIHLHLRQQRELLICSGILSSIFSLIKASSLVNGTQIGM